jgi:ABC-type glycerol-3-phosphate transport system permease component
VNGSATGATPTARAALFAAMTALALLFLIPVVGVILSSLKGTTEIVAGRLWSLTTGFTLENFAEVLGQKRIYVYLLNTLLVTVPASVASISLGTLAGYVFAKLPFRGSATLFIAVVAGMFFPAQVLLVPLFRLFLRIGLLNTLWPMIIVHTALGIPICALLTRNFFAAVPDALREAAILDGASELQVLWHVILPVSLPALAVLGTLQFTWIWNDFLWPLIFTQSDNKRTIMLGIVSMKGQYSVAWGVQGAMSLLATVPTLFVFLRFQRYFIHGMTMGAVKG